jgi:GxxExxY protein
MEFVDDDMEPDPELNRITNAIIGAAISVHRELGPGYSEMIYEEALAIEFTARGVPFRRQHCFQVYYHGHTIGEGRLDFLVEDKVIVELKTAEALASVHTAQVISYLRATKLTLAILINFHVKLLKDGIKRIAG